MKIFGRVGTYLFEMIAELDNRGGLEHSVLIDYKLAMGQGVDIALN